MSGRMMNVFLLGIAAAGVAMVGLVYVAFLRRAEVQTASGAIGKKTFAPTHTVTRYQASSAPSRQSWNRETFTIPDGWVFDVRIDGVGLPAQYSLEKTAGERFQVGQKVRVKYQERGIPPFWKRVYVLEMKPAE